MTQESHYWAYTLRKTITEKGTCTPLFITALCAIARAREQPRCLLTVEWIKKLWYIYTVEYYSAIRKECIWFNSNEMEGPRAYYTEWSKSERGTQIAYINTYICNTERCWGLMNLSAGQQRICRRREQSCGHRAGEGESGTIWESSVETYVLPWVK